MSASRPAADDLLREALSDVPASFGHHALSVMQLGLRLAERELAGRRSAPAGSLAIEAVAARAVHVVRSRGLLSDLGTVATTPGFAATVASSATDLRLALVEPGRLDTSGGHRPSDALGLLYQEFTSQLDRAGLADRSAILQTAAAEVRRTGRALARPMPLVLLDVAVPSAADEAFLAVLIDTAPAVCVTVPAGDTRSLAVLSRRGLTPGHPPEDGEGSSLSRLCRFLFEDAVTGPERPDDSVQLFSAPGEGRESVEIVRRASALAEEGWRFDEMAVVLRTPDVYWGLLDHAFARAGIPVYFSRGTPRPDPSGRAFLALLACAAEGLSAQRFAEYLSLAQVPEGESSAGPDNGSRWQPVADELLSARVPPGEKVEPLAQQWLPFDLDVEQADPTPVSDNARSIRGTLRAPWRWEALLVESAVIGGRDRWRRRLDGLAGEYDVKLAHVEREDPDSSQARALRRDRAHLEHLRRFALPIVDALDGLPQAASWGAWLDALEALAPRVLRRPDRVLAVLGELAPMREVGPVSLEEVRTVLLERLATTERDPPASRYGRVFVGTPDQLRGRAFRVVFVPGLAERLFPQRPREDPLLLDDRRAVLEPSLHTRADRVADERLRLRLAAGAATERLYLSYPRLDVAQVRARVPSFYALDLMRAVVGRVPDHEELERDAAAAGGAWLAWPAPDRAETAVDAAEHDLAVLGRLLRSPLAADDAAASLRGRARYLLDINPHLKRSLRSRWARWRRDRKWTEYDGLLRLGDDTRARLGRHRLSARPFSTSALQRFAACPYQFLLGAVYRLEPLELPAPVERLDPLTKGAVFHEMQRDILRALAARKLLPVEERDEDAALLVVDDVVARVALRYEELLAPAIARVWQDEMASLRSDLRMWMRRVSRSREAWIPAHFEFSFGLPIDAGHDHASRPEPVTLEGGFRLRGAVDLIDRHRDRPVLRVTDHKTGRRRAKAGAIVGGGEMLQPVLYSLAVEASLGRAVEESRLWYCTAVGEYAVHPVSLGDAARRAGIEVLQIVDRAFETGFAPAPREKACEWCDFRPVCGPLEEHRFAERKDRDPGVVGDLLELRRMP